MQHNMIRAAATVAAMAALTWVGVSAQGRGRGAGAAAAAPAQPSKPAPRRDISGVWMKGAAPPGVRQFDGAAWTPGVEPPLSAWGLEKRKESKANNSGDFKLDETNDPVLTKCYPPGVPRVYFHPYPFEIVQTPKSVMQIFEYDHFIRRFWTDGRPIPADPELLWMGSSVGRWIDDTTFEVVTVGFNDKTWLDRSGTPHTDQLKVTERFQRLDFDRLVIDFTFEDPKALAKPWTTKGYFALKPDWELGEISCSGDYLSWPGA